jgi:hypothetical protein
MILAVDVGPIILLVAAVLLLPALLFGGGVLAAILGWSAVEEAEATHEGSELIELNK